MCPLCLICGRPVPVRGSICESCENEGRQAENAAYFGTGVDAIAYGESRADWPRFRVQHIRDHVFIVYRVEGL